MERPRDWNAPKSSTSNPAPSYTELSNSVSTPQADLPPSLQLCGTQIRHVHSCCGASKVSFRPLFASPAFMRQVLLAIIFVIAFFFPSASWNLLKRSKKGARATSSSLQIILPPPWRGKTRTGGYLRAPEKTIWHFWQLQKGKKGKIKIRKQVKDDEREKKKRSRKIAWK